MKKSTFLKILIFCCFLFLIGWSTALAQQQSYVKGRVTEESSGDPIPGVSVMVKGTGNGTVTNLEGNYTLENVSKKGVLVFTFVGMKTREMEVGNRVVVDVSMSEDVQSLGEVIVVGYGTQKKANLTGSVATVSGAKLNERPAPNAANLLQGRLPGLQVTQPSAEPGRDNPNFLIRGRGSFGGGNDPLVLIDGVTGSFNNLNPDDIENVTVLKDAASAAIYGARAANGVILVTTKKGTKGQSNISYRGNYAIHSATALPDFITNSAEYMEMYNQAAERSGIAFRYPEVDIRKYRNAGGDPQYPSFDFVDHYFNPAPVQNHNLSFSGGGEKNTYNLSLGYLDQNALLPGYNFDRYNALLNYSTQISKYITAGTILNMTYKDRKEPPFTGEAMALTIYAAGPTYGPYLPDGSGRVVSRAYAQEGRNRNPAEYYLMGNQRTLEYNLNAQAFLDIKPFEGFTWSTKFAVNYVDEFFKMHQQPYEAYLLQEKTEDRDDYRMLTYGPDILGVTDAYSKRITPTVYTTLRYETNIAKSHNISALAGYEQISYKQQGLSARRINSAYPGIPELRGYSSEAQFLFPSHPRLPGNVTPNEWALQSLFGRVNYDYMGRYLLEGNLRFDGTSKVAPDYRWGLFPSMSAGWVISEENFLRERVNWLSMLKVRGSYGVLGNQDVGTYLYQDNLAINGVFYPFDNSSLRQGAVLNVFRDQSLRWESTSVLDFGLDMSIQNGLFAITFDWFRKKTYDILARQPELMSIGLDPPVSNIGEMQNKGIELELTHQNKIGEVVYGINGLFSTAKNELLYIAAPSKGSTINEIGLPYGSHYLYEWDGIFQEEDINNENVPVHVDNPNPQPGDLKMKDQDDDGDVDSEDRIVVDGAYPDFIYSFGFNVGYKGLQLNAFFQGVQGQKSRVWGWGVDPFNQGTPPTTKWRNAWTPENRSNTLPAIYVAGYPGVDKYRESTYYLQDASYLRLKNIMLSYTFPQELVSRIRAKGLTVYISGDNLLTWTKYEGADPERASVTGNFAQYPQAKIYNVGLNVKF